LNKTLTDSITGEQFDVQIVTEDNLSSASSPFCYITDDETCIRYTIYFDCVSYSYYAVQEDE